VVYDESGVCEAACDLDLGQFRTRYGSSRVISQTHVVVIRGRVPANVILDQSGDIYLPYVYTAEYLAKWINGILRVKHYKGVSKRQEGILRLEAWIKSRIAENPRAKFKPSELLVLARQWVPELADYKIDPKTLNAQRIVPVSESTEDWDEEEDDEPGIDETFILDALMSRRPERRVKGLEMLAASEEPELFEWCAMFLDDESTQVRVAAILTARQSEDPEAEMLSEWVDDSDKRVRAAAIGFMTRHGEDRDEWFRMGLTDPETHVRVETARFLDELDPGVHRKLFELALYDPNPKVAEVARKRTSGKGYAEAW